jgi:hypothetical protein
MAALAAAAQAAHAEEVEEEGAQDAPRCTGTTAGGAPCGMFRLRGSLFCRHHDPDTRAADDAARSEQARRREAEREARATARQREAWCLQLETPAQLRAFVAAVARAAWDRRIAPEDARVCLDGAQFLAGLLRAECQAARQ